MKQSCNQKKKNKFFLRKKGEKLEKKNRKTL